MHGGRELVREEGYVRDFSRTESTAHDAERDSGNKAPSTSTRGNLVEIDANRKVKKIRESAGAEGCPTKSDGAEN
jgi:hypothetical protein